MKPEHKNLTPIELAKLTWYKPDNPLYRNPEHPTIKLAGEIGELLDLYGKHKYKPGFDWMVCKCGKIENADIHYSAGTINPILLEETRQAKCKGYYTPLVLDELGDIYYYLRILAWMLEIQLKVSDKYSYGSPVLNSIETMYKKAGKVLDNNYSFDTLNVIYYHLVSILNSLNTTIEELTLLNYYKLNSDDTNHGWKDAQ